MATLTYDPTPADQPEFSPEEQESIAIGEAQAEAESQLLAGKFKDAEALEQAYIELQKKLGTNDESQETEGELREQEAPAEEEVKEETDPNFEAAVESLTNASNEFYSNGELSAETIEKLSELSSTELISAYIAAQEGPQDLSQEQIDVIHSDVGGAESYQQIMDWAQANLPQEYVTSYNNLVDSTNDPNVIRMALAGINSVYKESNGFEGEMLTGQAAVDKQDVFRSQAEVVAAMQDPRYDRDPAYRNDVFEKLGRSELQY